MDLLKYYKEDLEKIYKMSFVDSIIVFGSYIEKKSTHLSDLDVCVVTKINISNTQKDNILQFIDEKLDINIFSDLPLSLQFKILTKGDIFKTKKDLTKLKNNIMNEWFDFRPVLNRIYKKRGLLPII